MRLVISKPQRSGSFVSLVAAVGLFAAGSADAGVIYAGDVSANPTLINPSKRLYVGKNGIGTVDIDGGSVVIDAGATLGQKSASKGTVTLSGEGSRWENYGAVIAGDQGTGRLIIQSGADVYAKSAVLGKKSGSDGSVSVSGAGSNWGTQKATVVGVSGKGRLNVLSGANAYGEKAYIGQSKTGDGAVTVSGAGSAWTVKKTVELGKYGDGTIRVGRGGVVDIGENLKLATKAGSTAILAFSIGDNGEGSVASGVVNVGKQLISGKGTTLLDLTVGYGTSMTLGDSFVLVDYKKLSKYFAFSNVADDGLYTTGAYTFLIDYNRPIASKDTAIVATLTAMAGYTGVAEPSMLLGFGIAALVLMRRRRASSL